MKSLVLMQNFVNGSKTEPVKKRFKNFLPSIVGTFLWSSKSTLFPITKNGKVSGLFGIDLAMKTCFQLSNAS